MALSPARVRLSVSITLFVILGGSIYWINRYPIPPRRRPPPAAQTAARPFGRSAIDGVVLGIDGKPARADVSFVIEAAPVPMRGGPIRGRRAAVTRTTDDGRFTQSTLSAGHYIVVARNLPATDEASDMASLWAAAEVDATTDGRSSVRLTLRRSGSLAGHVMFDGRAEAEGRTPEGAGVASTSLSLEPADADAKASLLDGVPRVSPLADGRFMIPDVPPGQYRLSAIVPAPWVLDQVQVNGQEALDVPFRIPPGGTVGETTLTAIEAPNVLAGEAVDAEGRPTPFALVFAFPSDPADRSAVRRRQAARADARGRFRLTGLPSGTYLLGLAPAGGPESWYSPDFYTRLAAGATSVRLTAGNTAMALVGGGAK